MKSFKLYGHLNIEFRFSKSWNLAFINSLISGLILAYLIIFLEPFDTPEYQSSFRTLRLSGYALCFIAAGLFVHWFKTYLFELNDHYWGRKQLFTSTILLILLAITFCYFYSIYFINHNAELCVVDFFLFSLNYGLPLMIVVVPVHLLLEYYLTPSILWSINTS